MANIPPPPPTKQISKKKAAAFNTIIQDQKTLAEIQARAAASFWFDADSARQRARRAEARTDFEFFVEGAYGLTAIEDIWNSQTFTARTKEWLSVVAMASKGKVQPKIQAAGLWQKREALYWWGTRFISDMHAIYSQWNAFTTSHIQKEAINLGLSTSHYQKNDLSEMELSLMFKKMQTMTTGVENWKQHFIAWLMTYVCSVRPGSITVAPGYEQGYKLTDTTSRPEDETLRFSHMEFMHFEGRGIGFSVEFFYNKGHRNPHTRKMVQAQRKFRFLPTTGDQFEFDIATLMLAYAWTRGLFPQYSTAEELYSDNVMFLKQDPIVSSQAVFIGVDNNGDLTPNIAMRERALNPKLREMCDLLGLFGRNTMYSFRRSAIKETRNVGGTEVARDIAGHASRNALYAYDPSQLTDVDLVEFRLHGGDLDRTAIRNMFAQVRIAMAKPENAAIGLEEEMAGYVEARAVEDQRYIDCEMQLRDILERATTLLQDQTSVGAVGFINNVHIALQESSEPDAASLATDLQACLDNRRNVRRNVRREYRRVFREEKLRSNKEALTVITDNGVASFQNRMLPRGLANAETEGVNSMRKAIDTVTTAAEAHLDNAVSAADAVDDEIEETDLNLQALEHGNDGDAARAEPEAWVGLPEGVDVTVDTNHGEAVIPATLEMKRLEFFKSFVALTGLKTGGLSCILCATDPTVPANYKAESYALNKLDRHLKSPYHSKKSQLERAFESELVAWKADPNANPDGVICRQCQFQGMTDPDEWVMSDNAGFMEHVETYHAWLLQ